ncbi:pyruvate dehydrogenase E2 component (dihydrolipoamide acetyltransferase) [Rhodococcoides kyotonense]|uniref:Dihydrolipoamide acetyltransferase component of pyruvate dehydrogenase complex n=1 Tax=Rhodococcoides kyotonense TaxID=398843 RepID=A0A239I0C3_9NOCA|nr:pyruvate dehydrogenase E2 component (dihydrolipoamide acetyltransferase) [Rhodococcus kyotonensis]
MAQEIVLPKLGLTMQEGVIGEWLAQSGQHIGTGDVLVRLETDKVEVDVEAEGSGILATTARAGDVLPVGTVIGWLLADGEAVPGGASAPTEPVNSHAAESVSEAASAPIAALNGTRIKSSPNARRVAAASNVDLAAIRGTGPGGRIVSEDVEEYAASVPVAEPARAVSDSAARFVGPIVRRRASELGVDLADVVGSGVGGRVTTADVERAAGSEAPTPSATVVGHVAGPQPGDVIPLKGMRGAIARNMIDSLQTMAQLTHGYEVDVTELVAVRDRLKAETAEIGAKPPSLNDFVVKAAALALREHPILNAGIFGDEITLFSSIDIGVAVAVPGGLVVPVVRGADSLSVGEIAGRTSALASAARGNTLGLSDMEGATFSVSTLGAYGVDFFTPVVNPGNVAILGVGRVKDGFRWEGDTPVRTRVLTLSLTFDHRAVDGAPAADYLKSVAAILGRPLRLLAG